MTTQTQPKFRKQKVSKIAEPRKLEVENAKHLLIEKVFSKTNTVYCVLRSISQSGMHRRIDFYAFVPSEIDPDVEMPRVDKWYLTSYFDLILNDGKRSNIEKGLGVSGCGMDMGFHVVNTISSILFKNADGSYSHDGAYRLKSEWI